MMPIPDNLNWMKKGVAVKFRPPFLFGAPHGVTFFGRLGGEPFMIGNAENNRWVVRIEDMDPVYQGAFGRTVHSLAAVTYVSPIAPQVKVGK